MAKKKSTKTVLTGEHRVVLASGMDGYWGSSDGKLLAPEPRKTQASLTAQNVGCWSGVDGAGSAYNALVVDIRERDT